MGTRYRQKQGDISLMPVEQVTMSAVLLATNASNRRFALHIDSSIQFHSEYESFDAT